MAATDMAPARVTVTRKDGSVLTVANRLIPGSPEAPLGPVGHGRYVLKRISPFELRALYRCRAVLEALAVQDLEGHPKPRDLASLSQLVEKTQAAIDERDFQSAFQLNTESHHRLPTLSGNTYLQLLLGNIRRLILFAAPPCAPSSRRATA